MICSDIWNKYHEWYGFQQKLLDRVRTESWIHEEVWKRDVKSLKDGKKSWVFFKATTSASEVKFFSCWSNLILSRLHVMEKAFFLHLFKVPVDHLFYNLESGKRNYCFGKSLEKVLNFGSKICTNSAWKKPIRCPNDRSCDESLYQCLMNAVFLQARRAAADAAAGAAETIARMRLEAAATITESADRLVKVQYALILVESTCDRIPVY